MDENEWQFHTYFSANSRAALPNKSFFPQKIFHVRRKRFDRFGRDTAIQIKWGFELFSKQRFGSEHAVVRQLAPAKNHAIRSDETIFPYPDRKRTLTTHFQIQTMCHKLRLQPSYGGEITDRYTVGAINRVTMRDGRVLTDNQLRAAVRFFGEVPRRPKGKTADPIASSEHRMRLEMKQIESLAKREMINSTLFLHDQAGWIDPR